MANSNIISAVFDNHMQAEQVVQQLRQNGVPDNAISVIAQHDDKTTAHHPDGSDASDHGHDNKGSGMVKGLTVGAGVGALFGLAAAFIPGIGPFITAGALAEALGTTAGAAAAGAIVGGTAGGIAGMLMNYGVDEEDAKMYESRLGQGGVVVLVDTSKGGDPTLVHQVMGAAGGRGSRYMA